jgi:hypothetical protein
MSGAPEPKWLTKREAAAEISRDYFEVSPRSIERWPIETKLLAGRRRINREALRAFVEKLISEAPAAGRVSSRAVRARAARGLIAKPQPAPTE